MHLCVCSAHAHTCTCISVCVLCVCVGLWPMSACVCLCICVCMCVYVSLCVCAASGETSVRGMFPCAEDSVKDRPPALCPTSLCCDSEERGRAAHDLPLSCSSFPEPWHLSRVCRVLFSQSLSVLTCHTGLPDEPTYNDPGVRPGAAQRPFPSSLLRGLRREGRVFSPSHL